MAISKTDKQYKAHRVLGPKEVAKDSAIFTKIDVVRVTSKTGEQFHMECPLYVDDTREEVNTRMGMLLSVVQDRLEEENEAWNEVETTQLKKRLIKEAAKRNEKSLKTKKLALDNRLKHSKISTDDYTKELLELEEKFATAMKELTQAETPEELVDIAEAQGIVKKELQPPTENASH